jgi:glycosyltransferase involved in cell wall biosynthesis
MTAASPQSTELASMPQVSIITPTFNRQTLLPALWEGVCAQSVQDIEWLVHDHSLQRAAMFDAINDPRVRYVHVPREMSIGAKRNYLCDAAHGEVIVHFDDDDFYAPHYVESMLSLMRDQNADIVKLFGFFLYQQKHRIFAYWDLERDFPLHFRLSPADQPAAMWNNGQMSGRWGYGFSYVFHRKVWQAVQFPDQNHGEDAVFANTAVDQLEFRSAGKQDVTCSCLHIIHDGNTSIAFPQQILLAESLPILFPKFHS